jgi:hypothetical protein
MGRCADHLNVDSADEEWEEAWQEMGRLEWVVGVAGQVLPEEAATIQHQLLKPRQLLAEIHNDHRRELVTAEQVAKLLPVQAFAAGRTSNVSPASTPRPAGIRRGVGQDKEEAWRVSTAGGIFIVFEGGDGVGKTTQSSCCAMAGDAGHEVCQDVRTGDSTVGAMIRQIVLDPATGEMSPRAEALLYAADKAQHIFSVVGRRCSGCRRGAAIAMSTRCWPIREVAGCCSSRT